MFRRAGESGQEIDDGVGVQQLRHAVGRALIAFEVEAAVLAFAGGNQDRAAVRDHVVEDRQRVGGRDTGAFTVIHGAWHADESDALDSGIAQLRSAAAPAPVRP